MRYTIASFILGFIIATIAVKSCNSLEKRVEVLDNNQQQLIKNDSIQILSALNSKDIKTLAGEQGNNALKELKIKPKSVDRITEVIYKTKVDTVVKIQHDTIYGYDIPNFYFKDRGIFLTGVIMDDSLSFDLTIVDSLTTVLHRKKKKFLFIPYYSRKEMDLSIHNTNPYTKVVYCKDIRVEK